MKECVFPAQAGIQAPFPRKRTTRSLYNWIARSSPAMTQLADLEIGSNKIGDCF